jgi:hypothetical protein
VTVSQPAPTCSLNASPTTITSGAGSYLYWSTTNAYNAYLSGIGYVGTSGGRYVYPSSTTNYQLTAYGYGGTQYCSRQVTVRPPAAIASLSASPTTITSGAGSYLYWSTTNAYNVYISSIGYVGTSGGRYVYPSSTTNYQLIAYGSGGNGYASRTVTVTSPPTCSFSASPTTVAPGAGSTLSWSTANASSVSINQGVGSVPTSGTRAVYPFSTTSYQLTASGAGGTTYCNSTVTVAPAPTCSLSASPSAIFTGASADLAWTTANASSVSINQGIGSVPTSGTESVSPANTTTYRLTATGSGGTVFCDRTVTVSDPLPPPTATLEVRNDTTGSDWTGEDITIDDGDEISIRWSSTNADSCSGSNFSTGTATSGTDDTIVEPSPGDDTTYTVFCENTDNPPASDALTVENAYSVPELSLDNPIVRLGEDVELTWNTGGNPPELCLLTGPGVDLTDLTGRTSHTITATGGSQTFTLSCPGGSAEVTVEVVPDVFDS